MKLGTDIKAGLAVEVEAEKRQLGEIAGRFPDTTTEYMGLPIDERMRIATGMLRVYATDMDGVGDGNKPAPATVIPEDQQRIALEGTVAYNWRGTNPRPPSAQVSIKAVDRATKVSSRTVPFGEIMNCRYELDGTIADGWHAVIDPDYSWFGTHVPLSDPRGAEVVEFVDAAVVGLLEGVVAQHRLFLGTTAVEGQQSPAA